MDLLTAQKSNFTFKYERYLNCISNDTNRLNLTRLRLSAHNLEIEAGRYLNIERENRFCKICNIRVVESESIFFYVVQFIELSYVNI